ncbi:MAG: PAS domain-containing protein, partial [Saprospiraceae bacterium]
ENQELFHDILDHSDSIISIKDLTGRYVLINQAFENQFKIQKEDAVGKTAFDLFDRDAAEHIRNTDLEIIRILRQKKFEEIIPRDTDVIHYSSLKFPLFDTNLIPYAICSISTDETEKTQNENLHRDQMNRILDLFNNAPCGYQATDDNGIIIEINDTLLRWLGYTREEVIGKLPVKEIISPENQHQFIYYFPRIRSGEIKSIFDLEIIYIRKDRTKLSVIANTMAQYDEHGNFLYTRTSVFDISYRKRVEEVATKN